MSRGIEWLKNHPRQVFLVSGLLLGLVFYAFFWWPIFNNQFLMWDDDFNIYQNPIFTNGSWTEFWTKPYMGFYIPLTYTIWYAVAQLFSQTDPFAFKVLNLIFHGMNTILVFLLMRFFYDQFLNDEDEKDDEWNWQRDLACYLVSLIYLLHPMQTAAVAWHSGFRDLLSTFGSLLCLLLLFRKQGKWSWIFAALFFVVALLSKPSSVYLPGVIFGIALVLPKERRKRLFIFSGIWLVLAFLFIAATKKIQSEFMIGLTPAPWLDRPFLIMDSFGFYIRQFFGFAPLSGDYGRTPERLMDWGLWWDTQPYFWGFGLILLALFWKRWKLAWVFLCLWAIPLSPTSGLVHFNFQRISTVADHYILPALPGFCFLFLYLLHRWAKPRALAIVLALFVGASGLASGYATNERLPAWHDSETFFKSMLEVTPYSHSANNYLGYFAFRRADWAAAERYFRMALASQPSSGIASGNLAHALIKLGRFVEAESLMRDKLKDPIFFKDNEVHRHVIAMNYLANGIALASLERYPEAFKSVCQVFMYNPEPRDQTEASNLLRKLQPHVNPRAPATVLCEAP